jgi:hypothetical protein
MRSQSDLSPSVGRHYVRVRRCYFGWDQTFLRNRLGRVNLLSPKSSKAGRADSSNRVALSVFCLVCFSGWTTGSNPLNVLPSVVAYRMPSLSG